MNFFFGFFLVDAFLNIQQNLIHGLFSKSEKLVSKQKSPQNEWVFRYDVDKIIQQNFDWFNLSWIKMTQLIFCDFEMFFFLVGIKLYYDPINYFNLVPFDSVLFKNTYGWVFICCLKLDQTKPTKN